jgi:hypothetical protein
VWLDIWAIRARTISIIAVLVLATKQSSIMPYGRGAGVLQCLRRTCVGSRASKHQDWRNTPDATGGGAEVLHFLRRWRVLRQRAWVTNNRAASIVDKSMFAYKFGHAILSSEQLRAAPWSNNLLPPMPTFWAMEGFSTLNHAALSKMTAVPRLRCMCPGIHTTRWRFANPETTIRAWQRSVLPA